MTLEPRRPKLDEATAAMLILIGVAITLIVLLVIAISVWA
jgi:hypothetical protein